MILTVRKCQHNYAVQQSFKRIINAYSLNLAKVVHTKSLHIFHRYCACKIHPVAQTLHMPRGRISVEVLAICLLGKSQGKDTG